MATTPSGLLAAMLGVFIASVLGSGHCAGMCGPIMLFAIGSLDERARGAGHRGRSVWRVHAGYHAGRAIGYVALGAAAGSAGAAVDLGGSFVGLQRVAAIAFGAMMVLMGIGLVAGHLSGAAAGGASWLRLPRLPAAHQRMVESLHRRAMGLPVLGRAWAVGLLTPLLPCGWLYLYVLAAAGTASPLWGAAVLAAFWLGTVPMLAGVGAGMEALSAPLRARLPLISGLVVIALGALTVSGRLGLPMFTTDEQRSLLTSHTHGFAVPDVEPPCCNEADVIPAETPAPNVAEPGDAGADL